MVLLKLVQHFVHLTHAGRLSSLQLLPVKVKGDIYS